MATKEGKIKTEQILYKDSTGFEMIGFLAYNPELIEPQKTVLIISHFAGRDEYIDGRATQLANLGYVTFALDVYGNGTVGKTREEMTLLRKPLRENRAMLQQRVVAGLETVKRFPFVDKNKIIAIGYSFGGIAVLDLARSNVDVVGVVNFHGSLYSPQESMVVAYKNDNIRPKVLVLIGYNDPAIGQEQVNNFQKEMDERKADWELNCYGDTVHSFTRSTAKGSVSRYSERAEKRSWAAMLRFFDEIFAQ